MEIVDMRSEIFSWGMETLKFIESIWMPRKGMQVQGPTSLSSATGIFRNAKTDFSFARLARAS